MADVLVVKVNAFMKPKEFSNLKDFILKQKESGLILLPPYCDAQIIPDDIDIKFWDTKGELK